MRRWFAAALTSLLAAAGGCDGAGTVSAQAVADALPAPRDGDWPFDFWVLALSWSPTHCGEDGMAERDPQQCAGPRPYGFVVHGLWPQYEQGFPRSCPARHSPPGRSLTDTMLDIMPSRRLVTIQWERHGTCSGLDADGYFTTTRAARTRVAIPPALTEPQAWQLMEAGAIEAAFIAANPGLESDALAVEGRGNRLREVRVCLDHDLTFRACPEVDRRGEPEGRDLRIPPQRTGAGTDPLAGGGN